MADTLGRGVGDHRGIGGSASLDNGLVGDILLSDYFVASTPGAGIYVGAGSRATRYVGSRLDADIYLGAGALW